MALLGAALPWAWGILAGIFNLGDNGAGNGDAIITLATLAAAGILAAYGRWSEKRQKRAARDYSAWRDEKKRMVERIETMEENHARDLEFRDRRIEMLERDNERLRADLSRDRSDG